MTMRLHHRSAAQTPTTPRPAAKVVPTGAPRLSATVLDLRDASLLALLRASVRLAQAKKEKP